MAKKISKKAVAERYAEALIQSAFDKGEGDAVRAELADFVRLTAESAELKAVMSDPAFSTSVRSHALSLVADKTELSATMRGFLKTAAEYGRLNLIADVAAAYDRKYDERKGILTVKVVTAVPLSDKNSRRLTEVLTAFYRKDVRLDASVDPSLIGGLTVQVGSMMTDLSVQTQLQKLYHFMKGAGA
jgi:F-type H+-transporting ATPase subunit delta